MRIAVISHGASGGGSERVATLVANYLASKEHEVFFYAIHSDKREYFIDERVNYVYGDVPKANKLICFAKRTGNLRKFIKNENIDVMISFIYDEGLATYRNKDVKKIFSLRNDPNQIKGRKLKTVTKLYRDADYVVFQTNDARDFFDETISSHGVVIPNPIKADLPEWTNSGKKEIIAAGRLNAQKNFPMLIKAFAEFYKNHEDFYLTICGDGELKGELETLADSLGVKDSINFTGHVTDLHDRMKDAYMYVSSSDYEGISNSMLEAMAIGIPSICTDCPIGGAKMFIKNDVNGYLVPVGDSNEMAKALAYVADNHEKLDSVSAEARKIADELSIDKICSRWEALL